MAAPAQLRASASLETRVLASLTWKVRQGSRWAACSIVLPAESGARVATTLLREFANKRFTPLDVSVTGEVKHFVYTSDKMTLRLRRIRT